MRKSWWAAAARDLAVGRGCGGVTSVAGAALLGLGRLGLPAGRQGGDSADRGVLVPRLRVATDGALGWAGLSGDDLRTPALLVRAAVRTEAAS